LPTGYNAAYTVTITQSQTQYFSSLFLSAVTVAATAEAVTPASGPCILALGTSGKDVFVASGATQVELTNCDLDVNSSDAKGTEANGGATVFAQNINIDGGSNPTPTSEPNWASCTSGICYSGRYKTGGDDPRPLPKPDAANGHLLSKQQHRSNPRSD
jgi:hypothetical protein